MCCEINCTHQSEWVIYDGNGIEDYTEACTMHVGELLSDAPEHRIYPKQ